MRIFINLYLVFLVNTLMGQESGFGWQYFELTGETTRQSSEGISEEWPVRVNFEYQAAGREGNQIGGDSTSYSGSIRNIVVEVDQRLQITTDWATAITSAGSIGFSQLWRDELYGDTFAGFSISKLSFVFYDPTPPEVELPVPLRPLEEFTPSRLELLWSGFDAANQFVRYELVAQLDWAPSKSYSVDAGVFRGSGTESDPFRIDPEGRVRGLQCFPNTDVFFDWIPPRGSSLTSRLRASGVSGQARARMSAVDSLSGAILWTLSFTLGGGTESSVINFPQPEDDQVRLELVIDAETPFSANEIYFESDEERGPESSIPSKDPEDSRDPATARTEPDHWAGRIIRDGIVILEVLPGESVSVYAVEESLPSGVMPSEISDSGVFVPKERKIRWGPFFDAELRGLSYSFSVADSAPPLLVWGGILSVDGVDQEIQGDTEIERPGHEELETGSIVRRVSEEQIVLELPPLDGVFTYAVEELLPSGMEAFAISEGGLFDLVSRKLKWGPYFDDRPRQLTYSVRSSDGRGGRFVLTGIGSFDGVNYPVQGNSEVWLDEKLEEPVDFLGDVIQLTFNLSLDSGTEGIVRQHLYLSWNSHPGGVYVIESTSNLDGGWNPLVMSPIEAVGVVARFSQPILTDRAVLYRVIRVR